VAVLTGAGISAESGVPTFRDPGGLWEQFRPNELANIQAFLSNPVLVQKWYEHRRRIVLHTEPNPGHIALSELEDLIPDFTLITQNVDDLHRRAGSRNIVELHGNLMRSYCISCERETEPDRKESLESGEAARCPHCGGLIRPDVVWFGEMLPGAAVEKAHAAAERADVFLSIGTSALVYPAAGIPLYARSRGAYLAEINLERSAIAEHVDEVLLGKSGDILPRLVSDLRRRTAV
jgi:NAD-dependent deacetylase